MRPGGVEGAKASRCSPRSRRGARCCRSDSCRTVRSFPHFQEQGPAVSHVQIGCVAKAPQNPVVRRLLLVPVRHGLPVPVACGTRGGRMGVIFVVLEELVVLRRFAAHCAARLDAGQPTNRPGVVAAIGVRLHRPELVGRRELLRRRKRAYTHRHAQTRTLKHRHSHAARCEQGRPYRSLGGMAGRGGRLG